MNIVSKFAVLSLTLLVTACSQAKETLGLNKAAPDEFKVVRHAPLTMPPSYDLRPPAPGTPRPQEQTPQQQAKESLFGETAAQIQPNNTNVTAAENALLQKADAVESRPNIRATVDQEAAEAGDSEEAVIDKLMNLSGIKEPAAKVVDPQKEIERIQKNKERGKPITEGETPSRTR